MQIKSLHKNIYNFYAYVRKQETLDAYRRSYQWIVEHWNHYKQHGLNDKLIQDMVYTLHSLRWRELTVRLLVC